MNEFTKGKWIYYPPSENNRKKGVTECDIFAVQGRIGHFLGTIRYEANARLITAAPEMYEELIFAMAALRDGDVCDKKRADKIEALLARIDGDSQEVNS